MAGILTVGTMKLTFWIQDLGLLSNKPNSELFRLKKKKEFILNDTRYLKEQKAKGNANIQEGLRCN